MECIGVAPLQANMNAKSEFETANSSVLRRGRATKVILAARYAVGIRTIENWQRVGIIRAGFEQRRAMFDVADCDERLLSYKG